MKIRGLAASVGLLGALALVSLGGCAADDEDEIVDEDDDVVSEEDQVATDESALAGCHQCNNCVDYARCRQHRLPHGLTSWQDKVHHINSQHAHAHCVAMINTGSYYGHVAYVRKVSGRRVFIDEGNWPSGHCGKRSGTRAHLHIAGYWCP